MGSSPISGIVKGCSSALAGELFYITGKTFELTYDKKAPCVPIPPPLSDKIIQYLQIEG